MTVINILQYDNIPHILLVNYSIYLTVVLNKGIKNGGRRCLISYDESNNLSKGIKSKKALKA